MQTIIFNNKLILQIYRYTQVKKKILFLSAIRKIFAFVTEIQVAIVPDVWPTMSFESDLSLSDFIFISKAEKTLKKKIKK